MKNSEKKVAIVTGADPGFVNRGFVINARKIFRWPRLFLV